MDSSLFRDRPSSNETIKVLVVNCDPKVVHDLGIALRNQGCQTFEATSFEAAKQLWIAEKPPVLIVDVRLGQFNGLQLLLRAKADRPDVKGVVTYTFPDKVLEAETARVGGTFLTHPFNISEVITAALGSPQQGQPQLFVERRASDRRLNSFGGITPERRLRQRRQTSHP